MIDLNKIIRPEILDVVAYSSARDEYTDQKSIFLDANENPYGQFNRYPDPYQSSLKKILAERKDLNSDQIFIGNGSDEAIDLVFRIFCIPGKDKALGFSPSYGMYNVSAAINNVELETVPLESEFDLDMETITPYLAQENLKLIFICSPNNPTGNSFSVLKIKQILEQFNGIVILDEAYIDFSQQESLISILNNYPNLIIIQTLSKAWGLAAARIGMAYASKDIIQLFNKIKPPYNISQINQNAAIKVLENQADFEKRKTIILSERTRVIKELKSLKIIQKIYPSDTNFILVKVENADNLYSTLIQYGIVVRNRNQQILNCIRITIGTPEENTSLINILKTIENETKSTFY